MNPTVYHAVSINKELPEAKYALPAGFPFIADDDSLEVQRWPLLYLDSTFRKGQGTGLVPRRKRTSMHSVNASAYDLVDFLRYLAHARETEKSADVGDRHEGPSRDAQELPLHNFTIYDVLRYRDDLYTKISRQTHETLSDLTCSRRINRVLDYAKWLERQGILFDFALTSDTKIRAPWPSSEDNSVRSLSEREWHSVRAQLGPLPSEQQQEIDERPARNRLASELAIASGLRVDEIAKLTIHQVLALRFDSSAPDHAEVKMRVTQTKGLVARDVYVPMYLIRELQLYVDRERQEAMTEAAKFWLTEKQRQPTTLFVNGADAHQHAGKPIQADVLSHAFYEACVRVGLTHSSEKIDPISGEHYMTQLSSHHFHDLRHTFTIWKYYSEKEAGNPEPWKLLQALLGHKHLSTTLNTYLRAVPGERREVNRRTFSAIRSRFSGN